MTDALLAIIAATLLFDLVAKWIEWRRRLAREDAIEAVDTKLQGIDLRLGAHKDTLDGIVEQLGERVAT